MIKKIVPKKVGWLVLLIVCFPVLAYSLNTVLTGYRIDSGISDFVITAHSTCRSVTNTSEIDYFVPTKTSVEWFSVIGNNPPGLNFTPPTGGGLEYSPEEFYTSEGDSAACNLARSEYDSCSPTWSEGGACTEQGPCISTDNVNPNNGSCTLYLANCQYSGQTCS